MKTISLQTKQTILKMYVQGSAKKAIAELLNVSIPTVTKIIDSNLAVTGAYKDKQVEVSNKTLADILGDGKKIYEILDLCVTKMTDPGEYKDMSAVDATKVFTMITDRVMKFHEIAKLDKVVEVKDDITQSLLKAIEERKVPETLNKETDDE